MGNHNTIGQMIGLLSGLAKSYIDAKTAFKITEAKNQEEAAYK